MRARIRAKTPGTDQRNVMQPQTASEEFSDMKYHLKMWRGYTRLLTRGTIGVAVLVLFLGWITGVL
jgi:hypothetical protein